MMPSIKNPIKILSLLSALLVLTACETLGPTNYSPLIESKPRSILVIPPRNNSVEVNAPYTFLASITKPLAEKGYYVFPVAVIDTFFKENGLSVTAEMNEIPLDKLQEHTGADAIMYVTIKEWGQKYQVVSSKAVVSATLLLVDARTGQQLWSATSRAEQASKNSSAGLAGALVSALANQVVGSLSDKTFPIAQQANENAINSNSRGLLNGPYAPEFKNK